MTLFIEDNSQRENRRNRGLDLIINWSKELILIKECADQVRMVSGRTACRYSQTTYSNDRRVVPRGILVEPATGERVLETAPAAAVVTAPTILADATQRRLLWVLPLLLLAKLRACLVDPLDVIDGVGACESEGVGRRAVRERKLTSIGIGIAVLGRSSIQSRGHTR